MSYEGVWFSAWHHHRHTTCNHLPGSFCTIARSDCPLLKQLQQLCLCVCEGLLLWIHWWIFFCVFFFVLPGHYADPEKLLLKDLFSVLSSRPIGFLTEFLEVVKVTLWSMWLELFDSKNSLCNRRDLKPCLRSFVLKEFSQVFLNPMNLSITLRQSAAKQAGLPMLSQGCSLGFHGNSVFRAWCNPQKFLGHLLFVIFFKGTFLIHTWTVITFWWF